MYSTLPGSLIADESAGADFGSDSCAADHHGKTSTLAGFKGWAELLRAALSAKVLMFTASDQPLCRYCRDCA